MVSWYVTRYDVISTRWSSYFWVKIHVFSTPFNNKKNLVAKIKQKNAYLCVIYYVKRKKNHHFSRFKPDFKFLVKSKMATIVGEVIGLLQRPHPSNIPHLNTKIKGFPVKVYSFRNTATYTTLRGGGGGIHPHLPLYHGGGMNLRLRPRINCGNPYPYWITIHF